LQIDVFQITNLLNEISYKFCEHVKFIIFRLKRQAKPVKLKHQEFNGG